MNQINPSARLRIKKLRQAQGLTQQQLADKLGCSVQTIRRWESGRGQPNGIARKLISEIFRKEYYSNG